MDLKISTLLLCCIVYCQSQAASPKCNMIGRPPNIMLKPTDCCNITHLFDPAKEASCMATHSTQRTNINCGVQGEFDGLECFFDCLMNGTNAYQNGIINVQGFKELASRTMATKRDWIPIINTAIDYCYSLVQSKKPELVASMSQKRVDNINNCLPDGIFFYSCVYFQQLKDCPAPYQANNNNPQCKDLRDYYRTCPTVPLYNPNNPQNGRGRGRSNAPGQQGPRGNPNPQGQQRGNPNAPGQQGPRGNPGQQG